MQGRGHDGTLVEGPGGRTRGAAHLLMVWGVSKANQGDLAIGDRFPPGHHGDLARLAGELDIVEMSGEPGHAIQ